MGSSFPGALQNDFKKIYPAKTPRKKSYFSELGPLRAFARDIVFSELFFGQNFK
jgi:hypothetical protein